MFLSSDCLSWLFLLRLTLCKGHEHYCYTNVNDWWGVTPSPSTGCSVYAQLSLGPSYQRSTAAFCVQITSVPLRSLTINSQTCLLLQVLGQMLQAAWPSLGCVLPPAGRTACTARVGAWREVGWVVEWAWAQFGLQKQTNSKRFCIRKLLWYLWTRGSAEIAILCKKLPLILKSGGRIKAGAVWYSACWSTWIWICDLRTTQFRLDSAVALLGLQEEHNFFIVCENVKDGIKTNQKKKTNQPHRLSSGKQYESKTGILKWLSEKDQVCLRAPCFSVWYLQEILSWGQLRSLLWCHTF